MAWENLEEEIAKELEVRAPDLGWYTGEVSLMLPQQQKRTRDLATPRLLRKLTASKRARYDVSDRNRTYTVRKATRVYQRGTVCANDASGRFLPQSS
jgi:hypothetical protein